MSGNIRQQLYDRIRESSKDEVILAEMIRLGFWPRNEGQPSPSEDLIKRNGEIARELSELYKKQGAWRDPERALKELHKQRKRAAMERRKDTRLRRAQDRYERATRWAERRKSELLYLGEGVSGGLSKGTDGGTLLAGLPQIVSAKALAAAMGLPLGELRFLAYERALGRISHYQRFLIPKKSGGDRLISAPMPRLKRAQYWVLDNILAKVPLHKAAHGFAPDRSILTNAAPHVAKDVVVNLDLKDFFPTLTFGRVKGKFRGLGYSESVATVLALICTEPDVDSVELDGIRLYARKGPRRLPQGAPTSPALTNLICLRLDKRLDGLAAKLGFVYTRYADDMTFSASGESAKLTGTLLKAVHDIVAAEGFVVHPDKTRIMRRHRRQEVTGLIVNDRVNVPRDTLRRFRALLHQIEKTGPQGKSWGRGGNVMVAAMGFAQFVRMVDAGAGMPLVTKVGELARRYSMAAMSRAPEVEFRSKAGRGEPPLKRWWTPAEKAAPQPAPELAEHLRRQEAANAAGASPVSAVDLLGASNRRTADGRSAAAQPAGPERPRPRLVASRTTQSPSPSVRMKSYWLPLILGAVLLGVATRLPELVAGPFTVVGAILIWVMYTRRRQK